MKGDARAQVKGVSPAARIGFPPGRDPRQEPSIDVELGEVVEDHGNDFPGLDVGGEGRIERARIGGEVVLQGVPAALPAATDAIGTARSASRSSAAVW